MLPPRSLLARISVIAASTLFAACGGKSALPSGRADGESAASGGESGDGGTSGNTSFAGASGAGGNGGVGGSGPTIGAGFPICPGYNEPQICSAPGAECLDVAPCESGGCRRIRSVCTPDYYWAPDGGTACGFACSDGAAPTTCEIDELAGVFQGSFLRQGGDCELDYDPNGPVPIEEGKVAFETARCSLEGEKLSPDRCNLTYSIECREGSDIAFWTYSLEQLDEDGSALQGTAKLFINRGVSSCSNSYVVRFDQRP